jgi:hypothetical protein
MPRAKRRRVGHRRTATLPARSWRSNEVKQALEIPVAFLESQAAAADNAPACSAA